MMVRTSRAERTYRVHCSIAGVCRAALPLVGLLLCVSGSDAGATGRAVRFASADGTALAATLYEASRRPAAGVVLVHMLHRTKEEWEGVAARLQDAGLTVLALDLRGHGASAGSPAALAPMIDDVRAAIAWLSTHPGVRSDAVALAGASLGANLAAIAGADAPVVRALALLSPSLDYRGLRVDAGLIRKLGDRALWLAASTQDPYALRTLKELLAGTAPREQHLTEALAHGTTLLSADPALARALVDWLRRTLIF